MAERDKKTHHLTPFRLTLRSLNPQALYFDIMQPGRVLQATRRKLKPVPKLEIIPPLPLYRRILRAHRMLPFEQRVLGDAYVKSEFKLHRNVDNPAQIIGFLSQWQKYLEAVLGDRWQHEQLDIATIERMEPDKIVQLYELMVAAQRGESEYNAIPEELPRPDFMRKNDAESDK